MKISISTCPLAVVLVAFLPACSRPPPADVVFVDGGVYTPDDERSWAESVAVKDNGALLVGGSDWNVSSLNPLDAVETAVRQQDPDNASGEVLGKGEEIDLVTALDMYTRNAACIMRLENTSGTIEAGMRADLIVLDRNLFNIPHPEINETRVLLTIFDGKPVYGAL